MAQRNHQLVPGGEQGLWPYVSCSWCSCRTHSEGGQSPLVPRRHIPFVLVKHRYSKQLSFSTELVQMLTLKVSRHLSGWEDGIQGRLVSFEEAGTSACAVLHVSTTVGPVRPLGLQTPGRVVLHISQRTCCCESEVSILYKNCCSKF